FLLTPLPPPPPPPPFPYTTLFRSPNARRAALQDAMRHPDMDRAEGLLAGLVSHSPAEAFNDLQAMVQDEVDVHRVVLAYRAWDRSEEHTSELQSLTNLVCRLLLEK